jgi:peptidoglycan/LPS O-acetylase OafA/YrhL
MELLKSQKSNDLTVESLRGLAVLAVVLHHTLMSVDLSLASQNLEPTIAYRLVDQGSRFIEPLRMPLFTLLSGFIYALRPVARDNVWLFTRGKVRRVVVPLLFASSMFYLLHYKVGGSYPQIKGDVPYDVKPGEFWLLWFYHFRHFWFLHALLLIFTVVAIIDYLGLMRNVSQWLVCLFCAALLKYLVPWGIEFFSVSFVPTIAVFFIFGVGLVRFKDLLFSESVVKAAWVLFPLGMLVHLFWQFSGKGFDKWPHFLLIGSMGPICLLSLKLHWWPLVKLGAFSYGIYLYAGMGAALITDTLARQGFSGNGSQLLWVLCLMLFAVMVPIALELAVQRVKFLRTLVVGKKL